MDDYTAPTGCTHEVTTLRRFTQSNGTIHFTLQCQDEACLKRPNDQFIPRAKLRETMTDAEIDALPLFDHEGRERAQEEAYRVQCEAHQEQQRIRAAEREAEYVAVGGIKAIPTRYKGYHFRSRLEARWAVLFDALEVAWEYEPQGFDLGESGPYLPDFHLTALDVWVEVKGKRASDTDYAKIDALEAAGKKIIVLTGGIPGPGEDHFCDSRGVEMMHTVKTGIGSWVSSDDDDWGGLLLCPVCGSDCTHLTNNTHTSADDYSAWSGRGHATRIVMEGECGHVWELRIGFHKGRSWIGVENAVEYRDDFTLWLAGWDEDRSNAARKAARSAQFEHGESGAT